jgi:hypothetical protein
MLSKRQYQILNSCADDWELFYFIFAALNYGGQVFSRANGPDCSQYADEKTWQVKVSGEEVARELNALATSGMLECRRVRPDGTRETIPVEQTSEAEFRVYRDYDCLTMDEHERRFGYGPHEFKASRLAIAEMGNTSYRVYDQELGWPSP